MVWCIVTLTAVFCPAVVVNSIYLVFFSVFQLPGEGRVCQAAVPRTADFLSGFETAARAERQLQGRVTWPTSIAVFDIGPHLPFTVLLQLHGAPVTIKS